MKRYFFILFALLLLFLAACGQGDVTGTTAREIWVYRLIRPEYRNGGQLLRAEKIPFSSETAIEDAVQALSNNPGDPGLESALPTGVIILGAESSGRTVFVSMSKDYSELSGIDKTIADSSITLTMCSIPGVDYVSIRVEGGVPSPRLSTEDFVLRNTLVSAKAAEIRLYFLKTGSGVLSAEYRAVSISEDISAERVILDELLKGPIGDKLTPALPMDTVILSVYTQEGVCTVSFSEDFLSDLEGNTEAIELALYSAVNSLTCLTDVTSVRIIIQNNTDNIIGGIDISEPLTKKTSLIGSSVVS